MSKKNFKNSNPALAYITDNKNQEKKKEQANAPLDTTNSSDAHDAQGTHSTQHTQTAQDEPSAPHTQKTQGRKGQKRQRINMAFDDDNIEYLRLMSRVEGISMTQYVNNLLDQDRVVNADKIKKMEELLDI